MKLNKKILILEKILDKEYEARIPHYEFMRKSDKRIAKIYGDLNALRQQAKKTKGFWHHIMTHHSPSI